MVGKSGDGVANNGHVHPDQMNLSVSVRFGFIYKQGSHELWKSRKPGKSGEKIPCMEKSWNMKKT